MLASLVQRKIKKVAAASGILNSAGVGLNSGRRGWGVGCFAAYFQPRGPGCLGSIDLMFYIYDT